MPKKFSPPALIIASEPIQEAPQIQRILRGFLCSFGEFPYPFDFLVEFLFKHLALS